jgi:hypothetical protein
MANLQEEEKRTVADTVINQVDDALVQAVADAPPTADSPTPETPAQPTPKPDPNTVIHNGRTYNKDHVYYRKDIFGNNLMYVKPEFKKLYSGSGFIYGSNKPGATLGEDVGGFATELMQTLSAPGIGLSDFVVDLVNQAPGKNKVPKVPTLKTKYAETVRDLSSILLPMFMLRSSGINAGKALDARVAAPLGKNRLFQIFAEAGIDIGTGAFVDSVVKQNETDDNFAGTLKKSFPSWFSWISNDWATFDGESPDDKRVKNINEGALFGLFSGLFDTATTLLRARKQTKEITGFIPEDDKATTYFDEIRKAKEAAPKLSEDPAENALLKALNKQDEQLTEAAQYIEARGANPDEPILGKHNVFAIEETSVRTADDNGVVGAMVDAARIQNNQNTVYGRLGSILSEGAIKYILDGGSLARGEVIQMLVDNIRKAGKFSYEYVGGRVTYKQIDEAGTRLAEIMLDPRMDTGMLKATLDNFRNELDTFRGMVEPINDQAYNATMKAIRGYMDQYMNMDTLKAQAYLSTSLGGQVADMAEGARYVEEMPLAVMRAQEQILDRIEYLMVEKGLASYHAGAGLANMRMRDRMRQLMATPEKVEEIFEQARLRTDDALSQIVTRANTTVESLRFMSRERPEYLRPLMSAFELTNGNIDSLHKLNVFVDNSLAQIEKAFFDGKPEIPNVVVQGFYANIYNSMLTTISTPSKALWSNTALLLTKPLEVLGGAALGLDRKTFQRGWYQYAGGMMDSLQKGAQHLSFVFGKAASDPTSVGYIMRDDIARKNEGTMDVLNDFARAAEEEGNLGPRIMYNHAEMLQDLEMNPFLRFGTNAMASLDGFTRAIIASGESRARAYDQFIDGGLELNPKSLKTVSDDIYRSMFDSSGMITDSAVEFASREIAMNLDTPAIRALGDFVERHKYLKPFFLFPRTSANMVAMFNKYSPVSVFANDVNKLAAPIPNEMFSRQEIEEALVSRGYDAADPNAEVIFNTIRAEVKGRKAIGTAAVSLAVGLFLSDRLHGDGHFDKTRDRVRKGLGWKPRSIMTPDGKWISYDNLGPVSDWIAVTANIMDSIQSIEGNTGEVLMNKMAFILGASLTNKSVLSGAEPMFDVLSGNGAAISRWASSFTSAAAPLSGARNELGRVMYPALKELDQEFTDLMRNRNKFVDFFDPDGALADAYDWIDGKKIGEPESIWTRLWNATQPMKVNDGLSPVRQFLVDIEYDARPTFQRSSQGVEYTPKERSELFSRIGQDGYFREQVEQIMREYNSDEWRAEIEQARRTGRKIDEEKWDNLYNRLDIALSQAKKLAEANVSFAAEIRTRGIDAKLQQFYEKRGDLDAILELANP